MFWVRWDIVVKKSLDSLWELWQYLRVIVDVLNQAGLIHVNSLYKFNEKRMPQIAQDGQLCEPWEGLEVRFELSERSWRTLKYQLLCHHRL